MISWEKLENTIEMIVSEYNLYGKTTSHKDLFKEYFQKIGREERLSKKEYTILISRFGFPSKTLHKIGSELRLSKEGVRLIEKKALKKVLKTNYIQHFALLKLAQLYEGQNPGVLLKVAEKTLEDKYLDLQHYKSKLINTVDNITNMVSRTKKLEKDKVKEVLERPVKNEKWGVRVKNAFIQLKIETFGDLVAKTETEFLYLPSFGRKSVMEIKEKLDSYNKDFAFEIYPLSLDMKIPT